MSNPPVQAHWIKPNETSRQPRTHFVLDSEAHITQTPSGEVHTLRCAVTSCDRMRKRDATWEQPRFAEHTDAASVWSWIVNLCRPRSRNVVVAHNAAYDLRLTDGLRQLDAHGFKLDMISLSPGATWGAWRRDGCTIVLVDSLTWLPVALQSLGDLIGVPKPPLPDQSDDMLAWFTRCRSDVDILRDAWLRIVKWLRDNDAGNWRPTGAGTSWSYWRHKHYTHKLLSHQNADLLAMERRAAWAGRAEAWKLGKMKWGPWFEFDFTCAYANIAASCELPVAPLGEVDAASWLLPTRARRHVAYLLDCVIETDTPTVPTSHDGRIVWPIGRFSTTLWDHEARMASKHGARIASTRVVAYRTAPVLQQWANWCLDVINAPPGAVDPVIRTMVKHWSRALIGRFATRYSRWEYLGELPDHIVQLGWIGSEHDPEMRRMLQIGHRVLTQQGEQDGADASPMIMSWIMAESRVRLWSAMMHVRLNHIAYVDTDALIIDAVGKALLDREPIDGLRLKAKYNRLEILGTRKLVLDGQLRAAGVQRGAVKVGGSVWAADHWAGLTTGLAAGEPDSVAVSHRRIRLDGLEKRRRRLPGGETQAIRIR